MHMDGRHGAPESSFTVVPADLSNNANPTFEFSADDAGSNVPVPRRHRRLDGVHEPGDHPDARRRQPFSVRATDQAGNEESTPESYTWLVDAGAPSVQITEPSGAGTPPTPIPTVVATTPDGDVTSVEFFRCSDAP